MRWHVVTRIDMLWHESTCHDLWSLGKKWSTLTHLSKYAIKTVCPKYNMWPLTWSCPQGVWPEKLNFTSDRVLDLSSMCAKFEVNRSKDIKVKKCTDRRTDKQTNRKTTINFIYLRNKPQIQNSRMSESGSKLQQYGRWIKVGN